MSKEVEKIAEIIKECCSFDDTGEWCQFNPTTAACKLYNAGYRLVPPDLPVLNDEEIREILKTTYSRGVIGFTENEITYMVKQGSLISERKVAQAQRDADQRRLHERND